jgi:hypothetical protein
LRSTTRSAAVTVCVLLALALSGVAAGATQNAPAKQWVHVFCGSLVTWEHTVKSETAKLNTTITNLKKGGPVKLGDAKAQLTGFLGRVVGSTDTLVHTLQSVGAPAVPNGSKLQATLLKGIGQIRTAFANGKTAAQALPTNNRKAFGLGAIRIGQSITAAGNQAQAALSGLARYDSKALEAAFKADKACSSLGG